MGTLVHEAERPFQEERMGQFPHSTEAMLAVYITYNHHFPYGPVSSLPLYYPCKDINLTTLQVHWILGLDR